MNDLKSDKRALELEVKSLREEVANHQRSIGDALKRRDESDDNIFDLKKQVRLVEAQQCIFLDH